MAKLVNNSNIPLSVAVYLASNTYDFVPNDKRLSATDFNKSIRQIILRNRAGKDDGLSSKEETDIASLVKSKNGTAIHDSIEQTWKNKPLRDKALKALGQPQGVIDRIVVNPSPSEITPETIPVYMEIRNEIELDGYTIGGKFDFIADGQLTDFKSTGCWKYEKLESADEDYRRQGSIYRVIHKDKVTKDTLEIVFWFTDWSANRAKGNPKYPQSPVVPHKVKLWSEEETIQFMRNFIAELERYKDTPEPELPECTPKQLWQDPPVFKYYKNPSSSRATKVFDDFYEAQQRFIKDGCVGVVKTVHSEPKACKYCAAVNNCSQAKRLIESGALTLD